MIRKTKPRGESRKARLPQAELAATTSRNGAPAGKRTKTSESGLGLEITHATRIARRAFFRDLPSLLKQKKRRGQWVAYQGNRQLGFANSQRVLYQKCFRLGLTKDKFYVGSASPFKNSAAGALTMRKKRYEMLLPRKHNDGTPIDLELFTNRPRRN